MQIIYGKNAGSLASFVYGTLSAIEVSKKVALK